MFFLLIKQKIEIVKHENRNGFLGWLRLKKNIANFIKKKKLLNLKLNDSVIHKRKPEMLNRLKVC